MNNFFHCKIFSFEDDITKIFKICYIRDANHNKKVADFLNRIHENPVEYNYDYELDITNYTKGYCSKILLPLTNNIIERQRNKCNAWNVLYESLYDDLIYEVIKFL